MKVGDVCLTAIPQANGKEKLRPVMLMSQLPGFGDWLVCGISSQIDKKKEEWDFLIEKDSPYFSSTGLKKDSIIRLSFLAVIPSHRIVGRIGSLPYKIVSTLIQRLCTHLKE